ncbi:glycosyltransferase [Catenaria anguillulae PL171]|uniref:Dol-P-Man:Man(5)GlcNAc(2)-PP-Dol alpha-1,3-mannosyltransferase n=1 Tax=Catenaria anguillulae PL171 TaxID=765915 RepID=A0A1Y2HB83_9FUNG|nr:glycosyltransferase [Catenaria anguillulae PL171]
MAALLAAELAFCLVLIHRVPYTEIDWSTYMQQIALVQAGETNYANIAGDTGKLVYPAGHVWVFRLLAHITGGQVAAAQYVFAAPVALLPLLSVSKRLHSIHVLRMFNDPIAALGANLALLFLIRHKPVISSIFLSLAVSVKMSALLHFPAFLYTLIMSHPLPFSLLTLIPFLAIQVALAFPFLSTHPLAYLTNAFELSRVFTYKWTVNWRFVPEVVFVSREWALGLLALWFAGVLGVLVAWNAKWHGGLKRSLVNWFVKGLPAAGADARRSTAVNVATLWWVVQLVGIVTARSLHYQFLSWYWYGLPFLLWQAECLPWIARLALLGCIEVCWNVYPSTNWSSILLLASHLVLLTGVLVSTLRTAQQAPVSALKKSK